MHCFHPWLARGLLALALPTLAACSTPSAHEKNFGQATQDIRWLQTAEPLAPMLHWHIPSTDGESARRGVQRYYRSLDNPSAPAGVLGREAPKGGGVPPAGPGVH